MSVYAPSYRYKATCRRVIDGDTFIADVDLGFGVSVAINVRLAGLDAPERHEAGGAEATSYLRSVLGEAAPLGNRTLAGQVPVPLILESHKDDRSFERWVCNVWTNPERGAGFAIALAIIDRGHGVAWTRK